MLILYGRRLLFRKSLKGMGLTGIYRRTGRNFAFFRGGDGRIRGRGCGRGRGSGVGSAGGGRAKLGPATGVTRGLHRFGQDQEQKPHHVGYGGVVVGGNPARLAVELGFDGYGDVSDGTQGEAPQRCSAISLYWQCASEADNYLQPPAVGPIARYSLARASLLPTLALEESAGMGRPV